jgi:hypothetical protein
VCLGWEPRVGALLGTHINLITLPQLGGSFERFHKMNTVIARFNETHELQHDEKNKIFTIVGTDKWGNSYEFSFSENQTATVYNYSLEMQYVLWGLLEKVSSVASRWRKRFTNLTHEYNGSARYYLRGSEAAALYDAASVLCREILTPDNIVNLTSQRSELQTEIDTYNAAIDALREKRDNARSRRDKIDTVLDVRASADKIQEIVSELN